MAYNGKGVRYWSFLFYDSRYLPSPRGCHNGVHMRGDKRFEQDPLRGALTACVVRGGNLDLM